MSDHINLFQQVVAAPPSFPYPRNLVDTFFGHYLWTLFVDTFLDTSCGHFLWILFVDTFLGCFLWTFFRLILCLLFVDLFCAPLIVDNFSEHLFGHILQTLFVYTCLVLFGFVLDTSWVPVLISASVKRFSVSCMQDYMN